MKTKKILNCVTVTGADDTVKVGDLCELQQRYPYAEFGILLSQNNSADGCCRFPSRRWLKELVATVSDGAPLKLSGHICGKWVKDSLLGKWPDLNRVANNLGIAFQRFQLNTHGEPHRYSPALFKQIAKMNDECQTVIFQLDGKDGSLASRAAIEWGETKNIAGLFDLSHGRGVAPSDWPEAYPRLPCGYAGGLSPTNVATHLGRIQEVAKDGAWIDAETLLRSPDGIRFDISLVSKFLEAAGPWVMDDLGQFG